MTQPVLPADAVSVADAAALQRRRFLRGGALLAAATGGAVVASASAALPASAETAEYVRLGTGNVTTTTTSIATDGAEVAALQLGNAQGTALRLVPLAEGVHPRYDGLPVGSIVSTEDGPLVSVADPDGGSYLSWLATGDDLAGLPTSRAFTPLRVWDSKKKRGTVVARSSSGAIDAKGRLVKGAWVDVKVAETDLDTYPVAAFLTLGSSGSKKDGYLNAWANGDRPSGTVSLSFLKGKTLSGAAYTELWLNRAKKAFTVRVHASQTTYVTIDLSGLTTYGYPGPDFGDDGPKRVALAAQRARRARTSAR